MFHRIYIQISTILAATTVLLMLALGSLVYLQLQRQLQIAGQADLQSEVSEVRDVIDPAMLKVTAKLEQVDFNDDKGQNVYFTVMYDNQTRLISTSSAVPVSQFPLKSANILGGFQVVTYKGLPYRFLKSAWIDHGHLLTVYVYKLISQEFETLERLRRLMLLAGSVGIALAIGLSLWVARRALRPAVETWNAHQDMLTELSHELQTPLATINAIVTARVPDEEVRSHLATEVHEASSMLQDILYLSRLRMVPNVPSHPVAVSDITEEVVERFQDLASRKSIRFEGAAEQGLYVQTTQESWTRIISSLVKNVIDHATPGTTAYWKVTASKDMVTFELRNTSHPGPSGSSSSVKGFGLTIVRRLADDMKGQFEIRKEESEVTATVRVPRLR